MGDARPRINFPCGLSLPRCHGMKKPSKEGLLGSGLRREEMKYNNSC